jgi:hypothetical protein
MNTPIVTNDNNMTNDQPLLIRPSRDGDVEAMLVIYRRQRRAGAG